MALARSDVLMLILISKNMWGFTYLQRRETRAEELVFRGDYFTRNIGSILLRSFRATSFDEFVRSVALVESSLLVSLYHKLLQSGTTPGMSSMEQFTEPAAKPLAREIL